MKHIESIIKYSTVYLLSIAVGTVAIWAHVPKGELEALESFRQDCLAPTSGFTPFHKILHDSKKEPQVFKGRDALRVARKANVGLEESILSASRLPTANHQLVVYSMACGTAYIHICRIGDQFRLHISVANAKDSYTVRKIEQTIGQGVNYFFQDRRDGACIPTGDGKYWTIMPRKRSGESAITFSDIEEALKQYLIAIDLQLRIPNAWRDTNPLHVRGLRIRKLVLPYRNQDVEVFLYHRKGSQRILISAGNRDENQPMAHSIQQRIRTILKSNNIISERTEYLDSHHTELEIADQKNGSKKLPGLITEAVLMEETLSFVAARNRIAFTEVKGGKLVSITKHSVQHNGTGIPILYYQRDSGRRDGKVTVDIWVDPTQGVPKNNHALLEQIQWLRRDIEDHLPVEIRAKGDIDARKPLTFVLSPGNAEQLFTYLRYRPYVRKDNAPLTTGEVEVCRMVIGKLAVATKLLNGKLRIIEGSYGRPCYEYDGVPYDNPLEVYEQVKHQAYYEACKKLRTIERQLVRHGKWRLLFYTKWKKRNMAKDAQPYVSILAHTAILTRPNMLFNPKNMYGEPQSPLLALQRITAKAQEINDAINRTVFAISQQGILEGLSENEQMNHGRQQDVDVEEEAANGGFGTIAQLTQLERLSEGQYIRIVFGESLINPKILVNENWGDNGGSIEHTTMHVDDPNIDEFIRKAQKRVAQHCQTNNAYQEEFEAEMIVLKTTIQRIPPYRNIQVLLAAEQTVPTRLITHLNKELSKIEIPWIIRETFKDGKCTLMFNNDIIPALRFIGGTSRREGRYHLSLYTVEEITSNAQPDLTRQAISQRLAPYRKNGSNMFSGPAIEDQCSLPPSNKVRLMKPSFIEPQLMFVGTVGPNFGHKGGAPQVLLLDPLTKEHMGQTINFQTQVNITRGLSSKGVSELTQEIGAAFIEIKPTVQEESLLEEELAQKEEWRRKGIHVTAEENKAAYSA